MPAQRARCLAAGMDDFLIKPIQAATLLDAVSRVQIGAAQGCPVDKVVLDRDALMGRVGDDTRLLAEIAGAFSGESGKVMERARDALASGDLEGFAREIHTLHGMLRSVSGVAATDEARKLESLDVTNHGDEARAIYVLLEHEVRTLGRELEAMAGEV